MGYLAPGKFFENMLQLKCIGLYYERILDSKWLLSYRNNDISPLAPPPQYANVIIHTNCDKKSPLTYTDTHKHTPTHTI